MKDDASDLEPPHRLFHTLVVMGSALAFSCGGLSDEKLAGEQGSGGTNTGNGNGGKSAAGSPSTGTGGSGGSGGVLTVTGGTAGGGMPGTIHIDPPASAGLGGGLGGSTNLGLPLAGAGGTSSSAARPPAQWDCSGSPPGCGGPVGIYYYYGLPNEYYGLPSQCRCDETRPKTPADCAGVGSFVCRAGLDDFFAADASIVPFDCSCQPRSVNEDACTEASLRGFSLPPVTTNAGELDLCACSVVLLK